MSSAKRSSTSTRGKNRRASDPPLGQACSQDGFDPETYGGAYLLGLRGLVVIAHGSSSRIAIANAIRLAARGVEHEVVRASGGAAWRVSIGALYDPDGREVRFPGGTLA